MTVHHYHPGPRMTEEERAVHEAHRWAERREFIERVREARSALQDALQRDDGVVSARQVVFLLADIYEKLGEAQGAISAAAITESLKHRTPF